MNLLLLLLVVGLALILQLVSASASTTTSRTFYPAATAKDQTDLMFDYTGRWQFSSSSSPSLLKKKHHHDKGIARADWPCSGVQFRVQTTTSASSTSTTAIRTKSVNQDNDDKNAVLTLRLGLNRVRVRVVITNDATGKVESSTIFEGKSFWDSVRDYDVPLPLHRSSSSNDNHQSFTVSLTKLTQPSPYMMGMGHSLTSILHFHGVSVPSAADAGVRLVPFQQPQQQRRRRVQVIGASDTAGYCVDGTPETADAKVLPWKYDNCDATSHAVLGRRFAADMSIQAIPGIGLTQNAFADKPYLLGKPTMPDYYPRVLQTDERDVWKFAEQPTPDLVVVSLGGNDFNHQLQVPSSKDFESAYHALLHQIAEPYLNQNDKESNVVPTIVSICGQGDPTEHARDPNNDRCRPCPAVQQAVESFAAKSENSHIKVDYVLIPCDGTVVTGVDDIGCEGHKNRLGQLRVANYLEPRLRDIMKWHDDDDGDDSTTKTNTVADENSKNRDPLFDFEGEIVVTPASSPRSCRSNILWGLSLLTIFVLVARRMMRCCCCGCCCCRGGAKAPQYRRSSSSTSGSAMRKRYYYNRQRCSTASLSLSLEDDDFDDDIDDDDSDEFGRELQQQQACFDRSEEYYSTASSSDDSDTDNEDDQPQQRIVV